MFSINNNKEKVLCYLVLVLITLALYWDCQTFEFLNYDDNEFIVENENIKNGFSIDSLEYAFTDIDSGIWHPITWLSHIMDCQLYGLNPTGHHWNSIIFHILNVLLLFTVLQRITGAMYRSFFVALLFAIHPLQIESVAWISERKNLLSTFFYLLCILSYAGYVKDKKNRKYISAILFYILGLMSKPMMVTMPFVLLLLDFWPLERLDIWVEKGKKHPAGRNRHIIYEKIPVLILAIIFSIIGWKSQYLSGAMTDLKSIPLYARIELSLVSYVKYLYKLVLPHKLAFFYPYAENIPLWEVIGAALILMLLTAYSIIYCHKRKKYILVGWLWFLITMFPVIGLVHLGDQAMADRYMYVPCIGIFILIVWEGNSLITKLSNPKILSAVVCSVIAIIFSLVSMKQLTYWKNNNSLYSHAIQVTTGNYVAHSNLGAALLNSGKIDEAIYHFRRVLEIKPYYRKAHFDMGTALAAQKKFDEAKKHFYLILQRYPDDLETIFMMGQVCLDQGEYEKSKQYFLDYLKQNPNDVDALKFLGNIALKLERYEESKKYYLSAIEQRPDLPKALNNLGVIYYKEGDLNKADHFFKLALKYKPDFRDAYINLKNIRLQPGNK